MKRKSVIALALAAALSLSLFGCGNNASNPTGAPASQPPANTEQASQPAARRSWPPSAAPWRSCSKPRFPAR